MRKTHWLGTERVALAHFFLPTPLFHRTRVRLIFALLVLFLRRPYYLRAWNRLFPYRPEFTTYYRVALGAVLTQFPAQLRNSH